MTSTRNSASESRPKWPPRTPHAVFVRWKPKSLNQLLNKHWSIAARNKKAAARAWAIASRS